MRSSLIRLILALGLLGTPAASLGNEDPACTPESVSLRNGALGGTLAIGAFSTAGYLGSLADLITHKDIEPDQARVRLGGLSGGLGASLEQIDALMASGSVTSGDKVAMQSLRDTYQALKDESDALMRYVGSADAADAKLFRDKRAQAWSSLVRVMGLDEPTSVMLAPGGADLGLPKGH